MDATNIDKRILNAITNELLRKSENPYSLKCKQRRDGPLWLIYEEILKEDKNNNQIKCEKTFVEFIVDNMHTPWDSIFCIKEKKRSEPNKNLKKKQNKTTMSRYIYLADVFYSILTGHRNNLSIAVLKCTNSSHLKFKRHRKTKNIGNENKVFLNFLVWELSFSIKFGRHLCQWVRVTNEFD